MDGGEVAPPPGSGVPGNGSRSLDKKRKARLPVQQLPMVPPHRTRGLSRLQQATSSYSDKDAL